MLLLGVASGATDGSNKGWFWEQRPYMVLRGGWQFGKAEPGITLNVPPNTANASVKKSLKSAWAGSVEFGTSHFEDRLLCGIELGYFTGEFKLNESLSGIPGATIRADGDIENFFAVGNITLLRDFGERTFWYGGIGGGFVRRYCKIKAEVNVPGSPTLKPEPVMWKWSFLGQAFTGIGVYLTDDWQLTAGYRRRYVHGKFRYESNVSGIDCGYSMKQNIIHVAEVGLTYRF